MGSFLRVVHALGEVEVLGIVHSAVEVDEEAAGPGQGPVVHFLQLLWMGAVQGHASGVRRDVSVGGVGLMMYRKCVAPTNRASRAARWRLEFASSRLLADRRSREMVFGSAVPANSFWAISTVASSEIELL